MADLDDRKTQQLLRTIVREETRDGIKEETRTIVREEVSDAIQIETRAIVREETNDIRETVELLKHVQGNQSLMLQVLTVDVSQIKQTVRTQGVFYEDLESRFTALAENVSDNLTLHHQVGDHETRLLHLEAE